MSKSYRKSRPEQLSLAFDEPAVQHGNGEITRRDGAYWIVQLRHVDDCGPYATRQEATEDLAGMRRTLRELEGQS